MNTEANKIVLLRWIGQIGNRMFQYAFGCSYAKRFNCIFYVPSEWEGTIIFKPNKYCRIITDDILSLEINDPSATEVMRENSLKNYNNRTGDNVEFISLQNKNNIGKTNIAFDDLDCMYYTHLFDLFDTELIKEIYTFNETVLNSVMYQWYYNNKNIHTVCHLHRGDIAEVNYTGSQSMISKETYIRQLYSLCAEFSSVVWLSESKQDRTENIWNNKPPGHRWTYPKGEHYCPDIILDFLPDLLSMIFARVLLRGNSSLSWWGAFLSEAEVYSPVIKPKPLERKNKYYILDTEFVKGNAPHFMGCKLDADGFNDIIFPGKNEYHQFKAFYLKYVKFINLQPQQQKKIISFSLYETTSQYSNSRGFYKGIYVNYHLAKKIYPDWIIRVYMPYNEPAHIIEELSQFKDIELVLVDTNICLRALRFLPYDDPDVALWLSRDLDSIVNEREQVAVADWLTNYPEKELHIMTDHPAHRWFIAAGMFGINNNLMKIHNINEISINEISINEINKLSSLIDFMLKLSSENYSIHQSYDFDSIILKDFFYKSDNYIQHYGDGKLLSNSKPFPSHSPIDSLFVSLFVGDIVDINSYYEKLNLMQHSPVLCNKTPVLCNKTPIKLKNNDLFYYQPWNTTCIVHWYSAEDFTLTPIKTEKSTSCEFSCLKTENGEGLKLVMAGDIIISALWDGRERKNVYISDNNTIGLIHGNDHHYFTRVLK